MEALTGAYILLPEDIHSDHTTDSESVMDLHTALVNIKTLPLTRKWILKPYFSVIWRLHRAIHSHTQPFQLTHTLSHLEDEPTSDPDIRIRRDILKIADDQATEAHTQQCLNPPHTGDLLFSLHIQDQKVLINPAEATKKHYHNSLYRQIQLLPHTDSIYKNVTPINTATWPRYLRTFLMKVITDRLPTRAMRHKRQDKHADGTSVAPECTVCHTSSPQIETREHFLSNCIIVEQRRWLRLQKLTVFF